MSARRLLVAILSLAALLGVCVRAPALDVVRRTVGSLEAVAVRSHERPPALEKSSDATRVRVTRAARTADPDASSQAFCLAATSSNAAARIASASPSALLAPHAASFAPTSPTHADLMVFLN